MSHIHQLDGRQKAGSQDQGGHPDPCGQEGLGRGEPGGGGKGSWVQQAEDLRVARKV